MRRDREEIEERTRSHEFYNWKTVSLEKTLHCVFIKREEPRNGYNHFQLNEGERDGMKRRGKIISRDGILFHQARE